MRADICHYYHQSIENVYNAYKLAIETKFSKKVSGTPYHTLVFPLYYSLKYNMNGGGCHVHLIRYEGGTAVDIRYTISQLVLARYKAHDRDLTAEVEKILGIKAQSISLSIDTFLQGKNNPAPQSNAVFANSNNSFSSNEASAVQTNSGESYKSRYCSHCGYVFKASDRFCINCGKKRI